MFLICSKCWIFFLSAVILLFMLLLLKRGYGKMNLVWGMGDKIIITVSLCSRNKSGAYCSEVAKLGVWSGCHNEMLVFFCYRVPVLGGVFEFWLSYHIQVFISFDLMDTVVSPFYFCIVGQKKKSVLWWSMTKLIWNYESLSFVVSSFNFSYAFSHFFHCRFYRVPA